MIVRIWCLLVNGRLSAHLHSGVFFLVLALNTPNPDQYFTGDTASATSIGACSVDVSHNPHVFDKHANALQMS
jgi:hypothetical protein